MDFQSSNQSNSNARNGTATVPIPSSSSCGFSMREQQQQPQEEGQPHVAAPTPLAPVPRSGERVTFVRHCSQSGVPIELCYQCFGDPADLNPVILLVCGLNMQLFAWDETFCEALVRAGFFVVRFDNRDIGHSTKIEGRGSVVGPRLLLPGKWASMFGERLPYTIESMAKDGLALLDALHIASAHVFGVSMGGMIAQTMTLLAPTRVLSLTSIMSTTNASDLPDAQMWVKLWMLRKPPAKCTVDELLTFRVNSLRRLLEHALPVDADYLKQRYLMSLRRSSYGAGLLRQAGAIRRCRGRDNALKSLTIPALVIHGAHDVVVPPVHGYRTALCLRFSRLLILKSMGHYLHPAFFNTMVMAFADMAATTVGKPMVVRVAPSPAVDTIYLPSSMLPPPGAAGGKSRKAASTEEAVATTPSINGAPAQNSSSSSSGGAATSQLPAATDEPAQSKMISSMGVLFTPVVISVGSKLGRAAIASVNRAVPGIGDPALPQAVLIDLHEGGVSTPPTSALSTASPTRPSSPLLVSTGPSMTAEPTHTIGENKAPGADDVQQQDMQTFVMGSPSTWHKASFPVENVEEAEAKAHSRPIMTGVPLEAYLMLLSEGLVAPLASNAPTAPGAGSGGGGERQFQATPRRLPPPSQLTSTAAVSLDNASDPLPSPSSLSFSQQGAVNLSSAGDGAAAPVMLPISPSSDNVLAASSLHEVSASTPPPECATTAMPSFASKQVSLAHCRHMSQVNMEDVCGSSQFARSMAGAEEVAVTLLAPVLPGEDDAILTSALPSPHFSEKEEGGEYALKDDKMCT